MIVRVLRRVTHPLIGLTALALLSMPTMAQDSNAPGPGITLFENVRIFDGTGTALSETSNVLVRDNLIARISRDPIPVDRSANTTIVKGDGRTLMPGLIDAHWHATLVRPTPATILSPASVTPTFWQAPRPRPR